MNHALFYCNNFEKTDMLKRENKDSESVHEGCGCLLFILFLLYLLKNIF